MCGIAGWLSLDGVPVDREVVQRMTAALVHRGPDDEGIYYDGPVALAQRRLSIIDVAGGHQPLANEDESVWITYNGEIYNFQELLHTLAGRDHRFRTRCDTEVVVHAYEEYGLDCLPQLNGMYAFALWDGRARRLLLARDPFGIKPLYVWQNARYLLFASEIKAFLADPRFPREVDPVALDEYLTFQFVPSPRTIFKGVQKVPPGHCMVIEGGKVRTLAFARSAPSQSPVPDEAAAVAALQERLFAAVQRQMISDVPVGAMLSGGVDSATVVAIMRQVTAQPVKTFTVGFEGDFAKDEIAAARRSAAILGTEHHDVVIGAQDCLDAFAATIWHLDEPVATPSALAMYWVSRLAAQHVKVVLTGQGADEPWAGYRRYRGEKLGVWYRRVPRCVRKALIAPLAARLPRAEAFKRAIAALGDDDPVRRFVGVYSVFSAAMKQALYRDGLAADEADTLGVLGYWQEPVAALDPLAQQLYVETRFSLPDNLLLYGDKMAMAWSLEARVPLLDLELMAFVESLPVHLRLHGWSGHKYLYRKAITKWLPEEIMRRPKIGFITPMDEWFQSQMAGHVRERIAGAGSACARYFNPAYIDTLIRDHVARREDHTRALYSLLVFEYWHERFVTRH
jgi:asparagine synthase (glutamine-hydrolysing)